MKRHLLICLLAVFALALAGCSQKVKTMDQRTISQQGDDAAIEAKVKKEFVADEDVSALGVSVYSYNGRVYLVGEYDSITEMDRAIDLARKVDGVRTVTAYMLHEGAADSCGWVDEKEIEARVASAFLEDDLIKVMNVEIEVVQCHVVLLGVVEKNAVIGRAVRIAKGVKGVREVRSYLRAVGE